MDHIRRQDMADLVREGAQLVLRLSTLEKVEGVHGDITIPISSVTSAIVMDDVIHAVHGMKLPGTRLPGFFAMGTFVSEEGHTFAMVHHNTPRGIKLAIQGGTYDALILGSDQPEALLRSLGLAE